MNVEQIKQQLEQQLLELSHRAESALRDARHQDEGVPGDFAEQVTERENDEVLAAISHEATQQAQQIRQALQRIEDGSYGECVECGKMINAERLHALPAAVRCIQCEEKRQAS
ncbi:TraR/DksA family transcriptional regulator [Oceanobacter mangrovi]|uniref:TraR/DksA family transcriptional regulator n=1 Tax=Oceanobacter mangrovi TaxID=2862510 RepID=UPI001C8E1F8B|nr:TraR/DksA C4-type zinc finger protein [Oceanobacter mangrovi]